MRQSWEEEHLDCALHRIVCVFLPSLLLAKCPCKFVALHSSPSASTFCSSRNSSPLLSLIYLTLSFHDDLLPRTLKHKGEGKREEGKRVGVCICVCVHMIFCACSSVCFILGNQEPKESAGSLLPLSFSHIPAGSPPFHGSI